MSALTKIFVVLNVILSIILTAGVVVWVNRSEPFLAHENNLNAQLKMAKIDLAAQVGQVATLNSEKIALQQAMQKTIDSAHQALDQMRAEVVDRDTQIAQLNANLSQLTAAQKSVTDALNVAQKTVDQQTTAIAELRKSTLDLDKRAAELSFALNNQTNNYEVANRQWKDSQEQVAQLQSENQKYRETIHKAGLAEGNAPTINAEPLVRVEGVIRSKQDIGGVPYATISVGSADQVTPGMQFKVIDPQARDPFLGYLIVDRVEPNEAIGHLTGPRIGDIHAGAEVRTQL